MGIEMTEPEIKDRLDKWFGLRYASYPQPLLDAIKAVISLPRDQRASAVNAFKGFFCVHCGSDDSGCQCSNDD
jgi:hypothetical protein